jgi:hypothetical protein
MTPIHRLLIRILAWALALSAAVHVLSLVLAPARGLRAEYFVGEQVGGVPAIAAIDTSASTDVIRRRWMGAAPAVFTARWFGYLNVQRSGRYTFTVSSDDSAVVTIDGTTVIDNGGRHGVQSQSSSLALERGPHSVAINFTEFGGGFALNWNWAAEGDPPAPVPAWVLTPQKTSAANVLVWHLLDMTARALTTIAVLLPILLLWQRRTSVTAHPTAWALVLFVLLALVHTWPLVTDIGHLTRHDNRDSMLNEWIVAWVAHQLPRAPLHLFDGNVFYPERFTVAYSEPMIVQAVMAMPLLWAGGSVVLASNVLLIAGMALSGWTMALVVRRWTADWTAGLVAGSIYAFNAHSLSRIPHLQAQHLEFLPLALFAFDRLLAAPTTRNALTLAGWFVLQSLTSVYLLVIATFALIASVAARATDLRQRPVVTLRALAVAGAVSAAALIPFLLPYWFVSRDLGLVRTLGDAQNYAATWSAYLATPARLHQWWSARFAEGNVLFPGALGLILAGVAVARGVAFSDRRARMCLVVGIVGVVLSFGAAVPGYSVLYTAMPLLRAIRATSRFGILATCAVAVLAGFGITVVRRALAPRTWAPVAAILVLLAAGESLAAPLGLVRFDGIPPIYARIPQEPSTVLLEVPFYGSRSAQFHAQYMLYSTAHWRPIVNGYSGFQPPSFYENAAALERFPDETAFTRIHALGVTHIAVHSEQMPADTAAALDARTDIERVASFGAILLYRLK